MKVIKIGAVWCAGCLVMRPRWNEIEAEFPDLETQYYDYDQDPVEVSKYGLDGNKLPTFIFLNGQGGEITRLHGEVPKKELISLIQKIRADERE